MQWLKRWITNKALMWIARRIARSLSERVPTELRALYYRARISPSTYDDAGVRILQGIVDPDLRPEETSKALTALMIDMENRVKINAGRMDDALVVVLRGALNA